jgi:hypothetical protein
LNDGDNLTLNAEERQGLIGLLRWAIDEARYPYSRRYNPIKAILAKLDPPPLPAPAGGGPRVARGRRRR